MSDKPLFGSTQKIAIGFMAGPYVMNYALVFMDKLEGAAFWSGSIPYVSLCLGVLVAGGAYIKGKVG